ncbi:MAG TPA: hypothetical protein DDX39_07760 [Bacteroidales bacterium]|nr:MAG: hypothetical protein A2W98_14355 [Bacteroidetes bacterium GWF2_33_38]OFY89110.1 MAG: hypothetical protein A2236_03855 [Bacteroidetes bacterium RIFOXYA2_FULL_33_7]HBF88521.1 hypothetical protein [Bacteroidales bacterium]
MKKSFLLILLISILANTSLVAQQWGLYTFYSPQNTATAYLIDTNGTTFKSWTSLGSNTGYSAYLISGDTIVRSVTNTGNALSGGGLTGKVQKIAWDGTIAWTYTYSSSTYCLHHDICPMPNGNVLMISYDVKSSTQATQAGASSASQGIYSEKIIEVKPTGASSGTIVWEWKLWDHLCQEYSSAKDNYIPDVKNAPQLMDINCSSGQDRFHMNGIDYNEELDQIVVSMHYPNEVFVIDHSTTTAEAASHVGGNLNKGGDFLYRWGNPSNYDATGTTIFDVVHDAHWVSSENPNYPNYLCAFNNKGGTSGKSAFTIWNPSSYELSSSSYVPSTYNYQYSSSYSANNMGNSQQLPNGNSLMCIPSMASYVIEVNSSGTTLWSKTISGTVPHAYRYEKCYVRGPKATCSTSDSETCAGTNVNLSSSATSVTETSPTYTYSWTSSPTGFTSSLQNPTFSPTVTTTFNVVITNTNVGCSDESSIQVNVNPLPEANAGNDVTIDEGESVTLIASGGETYSWSTNENTSVISVTPDTTTIYEVMVTDENGCTNADNVKVTVDNSTENKTMKLKNDDIITIFPNPTDRIMNIEINKNEKYEVMVYDIYGRLIVKEKNISVLDLSQYSNGVYSIAIKGETLGVFMQKIVLMK